MGIPGSVALESGAAPVMTEAVSFDDHSTVAPDEVHLVGAKTGVDLGSRQSMSAAEAPKEPLELAAGEVRFGLEIRIFDQTKIQRTANGLSVEGLGKDAVEVPERSGRFGDRDVAAAGGYTDSERVGSVDRDTAAALASTIARKGDVDRAARRPQHAPESRCALVADDGPLPERE
jgi:hypothetical protein